MTQARSRGVVAEVGIIGAGVHGASAAFHLARRGLDVIVFERGRPAGGPTGRSSGICRAYYTQPFLARAAHDSIAFLAEFAEHADGADAGFVRTGGLYLHGPDDAAAARRTATALVDLGVSVEVLGPDEVTVRFPGIDLGAGDGPGSAGTGGNVAVAVREEQAGYADPYRTTWGFVTAARARGAVVHADTRVVRITETPGQVELTTADGTTHRVQRLLLAAGPWTAPLAAQLGVPLPLHAERHVVALLGPVSGSGPASTAGATSGGAGSARRGAVPPDIPGPDTGVIIDVAGGYYAAPQPDGGWMLGGLEPTPPVDPDAATAPVRDTEFARLAEAALRRRPGRLGETRARAGGWSALYDVSPDWQPVIGQITDRVWVDAGTSGHGFKLAPVLGDHVAGLLAGEAPAPGLAEFDPGRFTAGDQLTAGFGTARILG